MHSTSYCLYPGYPTPIRAPAAYAVSRVRSGVLRWKFWQPKQVDPAAVELPGDPSCAEVMRVLHAHLDGELCGPTVGNVIGHLEMCEECGLDAETFSAIQTAITRCQDPDPAVVERLRVFALELAAGSSPGDH